MVTKMSTKTYSEMMQLNSFEERLEYLRLNGCVGKDTFGFDRFINQKFYRSAEWKKIRNHILVRDNCCDLAVEGYDLTNNIIIHHMNPITEKDILMYTDYLTNPEYLVCVSHNTHNIIHYGDNQAVQRNSITIRTPNDTTPWRH